jgi:hypothetical protein
MPFYIRLKDKNLGKNRLKTPRKASGATVHIALSWGLNPCVMRPALVSYDVSAVICPA